MTRQRINRLAAKIEASRGRILRRLPAFGMLLMYFRFVAAPTVSKATVDYLTVYLSPDYLDKLTSCEVDYLLCHLLLHVLRGDPSRDEAWWGDDYHLACDMQMLPLLDTLGYREESYPHLGKKQRAPLGNEEINIIGKSTEEILGCFVFSLYDLSDRVRATYLPDCDAAWNGGRVESEGQTVLIDVPDLLRKSGWEGSGGAGKWGARLAAASAAAQMQGLSGEEGESNAALLELLEINRNRQSKLNWRRILQEFMQETVNDYSFAPPDRRFSETPFFLPDLNDKELEVKDLYFMVDASGSVDREQLSVVYAELLSAMNQMNGRLRGWISFFDVEVTEPISIASVKDIEEILPRGGGGTSFAAVFRFIRELADPPSCVILFTDGYDDFPSERSAGGVPTMWILDNDEVEPPWGKVVRLTGT